MQHPCSSTDEGRHRRNRCPVTALMAGVLLLVALLGVSACGGGGGTGGTEPVTRLRGNTSPSASSATANPSSSVPATPGIVGERQGGTTSGAGGTLTNISMTDGLKFDPQEVTIAKGGKVTWVNNSGVVHTVTGDPSKASNPGDVSLPSGVDPWDSGNVDPGKSYSHTFDTPGTYKYVCVPHEGAGMVGTITVTP